MNNNELQEAIRLELSVIPADVNVSWISYGKNGITVHYETEHSEISLTIDPNKWI